MFIFKLQLHFFFCNDHNGVNKFWSSSPIYFNFQTLEVSYFIKKITSKHRTLKIKKALPLGRISLFIWNVSAKSLFVNKQKFKSNLHNVCLIRKGLDESFELPCLFLVKCAASQILNELPKQRNTKEPNPMKNSRKQNPWKQWAMHFPWWWPLCRYFLPFSFWF